MNVVWQDRINKICFVLLCALGVVLPILESPKTLFVALLFLAWLVQLAITRPRLRRPDSFEWALIALMLASLASTVINWPFSNGTKGLKDTFYWSFVGWFIYRAGYSAARKYTLALFVSLGTLAAIAWGISRVIVGTKVNLEFHSAGVVTQAAIYLSISLFAALGVAYFGANASNVSQRHRVYWRVATLVMFIGLFLMASRGAILGVIVVCALLVVLVRDRRLWAAIAALFVIAVAATLLLPNRFDQWRSINKIEAMVTGKSTPGSDIERRDIWRVAVAQIERGDAILFGIGPRNYKSIDPKSFNFDPPLQSNFTPNHAHNLFLTKYIEEGVVGLAAFLFLLLVVAHQLFRDWRADNFRHWPWLAGVAAILVPTIAGSFNTPWYQEHAILAMIFVGLCLSDKSASLQRA
ncbi:MAG TPA: O-antigen ligase family protein [Burkholderiales bacterium]|nr:O-antigen ligase family protein [Burkholderiales bacterium]